MSSREQLAKAGIPKQYLREAHVDMWKSPERTSGWLNHTYASGYNVRFQAHAVTDLGRAYDSEVWRLFIAPHDPKLENRSTRAWRS